MVTTRHRRTMRRSKTVLLGILATALLWGALLCGSPAGAQDSTTTTAGPTPVTVSVPSGNPVTPSPDIIPRPGEGRAPRDPGDRGGWWQEALFFLMCGAMLVIVGLVWRDSRRARRRQGRLAPRSNGTDEPAEQAEPAEQTTTP